MSERPENGCPPPPPPPPSEQPSVVEPQAGSSSTTSVVHTASLPHHVVGCFNPRPLSATPPMPPLPPPLPPISSDEPIASDTGPSAKKVMCRDYIRGLCSRGDKCKYSHVYDPSQLRGILNFCHDYQNKGTCEWSPRCKYIHASIAEQRVFNRTGEFPEAVRERNHMFHPTTNGASMVETALSAQIPVRSSELDASFISQPPPPPPPPPATPPIGPPAAQARTPTHPAGPPPVTLPPHRNEHFFNTGPMWDPRFPPPSQQSLPRVPPPNWNYSIGERQNEGILQSPLQPRPGTSSQYQSMCTTLKKADNTWPQMSLKIIEETSKRSWSDVEDAGSPVQPNLKKYKVEYSVPCSNCNILENSLKTAYSFISELEKTLEGERSENRSFKEQIFDILGVKGNDSITAPSSLTRSSRSPVQMAPPLQLLRQQMTQLPMQKEQSIQQIYPVMQMAMPANNLLVPQRRMSQQSTTSQTIYARAGSSLAGPSQISHTTYAPPAALGSTSLSLVQQQRLESLFTPRSTVNYGNPEIVSNGVGSSNIQQFLLQGPPMLPQAQTMHGHEVQPQGQQMQLQGQHIQLQGQAMQQQGAHMTPQAQNLLPSSQLFQHQQQPGQQPGQASYIQAQGQINYNMANLGQ